MSILDVKRVCGERWKEFANWVIMSEGDFVYYVNLLSQNNVKSDDFYFAFHALTKLNTEAIAKLKEIIEARDESKTNIEVNRVALPKNFPFIDNKNFIKKNTNYQ